MLLFVSVLHLDIKLLEDGRLNLLGLGLSLRLGLELGQCLGLRANLPGSLRCRLRRVSDSFE